MTRGCSAVRSSMLWPLVCTSAFFDAVNHASRFPGHVETNAETGHPVLPGLLPLRTTAVDGLDTLMLSIGATVPPEPSVLPYTLGVTTVSVFETFIRIVGGLLAVYDMGGGKEYLKAAGEVADSMAPAWAAGPVPFPRVDLAARTGVGMPWFKTGCTTVADAGTIFFELDWLANRTNNTVYRDRADALVEALGEYTWVHIGSGSPCSNERYEPGVGADSWFEMLVKTNRKPSLIAEFWKHNQWNTMSTHGEGGHLRCIWPIYVDAKKLEQECVGLATHSCHTEPEAVEMMHTKGYNMTPAHTAFQQCRHAHGFGNPVQASWVVSETIKYIYSPAWCNGTLSTQAHCRTA